MLDVPITYQEKKARNDMNNEKGFTLTELILVVYIVVCSVVFGGMVYVVSHFVIKYW